MKPRRKWQWFSLANAHSDTEAMLLSAPRICISSTQGGGGKTLLSLGLARAFSNSGIFVKPFKKGPDYIDTAWLGRAAHCPATNLDPFFFTPAELANIFCTSMATLKKEADRPALAIIEGNRGIFDGLNETGSCSTSHVARVLGCPILLCIDCRKTTRTMAAIINGLLNFEPGLTFAGVILNRVGSARHEISLRNAIEANTSARVLGCLPRLDANPIPERHMGLTAIGPAPDQGFNGLLDRLAGFIQKHCSLDQILEAANSAAPLDCQTIVPPPPPQWHDNSPPNIGVIRDDALWFYYPENIEALKTAGAKIHYLSILDSTPEAIARWQHMDGLYLGGGFPEDHAQALSSSPLLKILGAFAENMMPIYAECGGMLLLCQHLEIEKNKWPMGAILPATAVWTKTPQGLGYVEGEITDDNPWYPKGASIKAHEFHYSVCRWEENAKTPTLRLIRGKGLRQKAGASFDGFCVNNVWASYAHIFAPAVPGWAPRFVELAARYKADANKISRRI